MNNKNEIFKPVLINIGQELDIFNISDLLHNIMYESFSYKDEIQMTEALQKLSGYDTLRWWLQINGINIKRFIKSLINGHWIKDDKIKTLLEAIQKYDLTNAYISIPISSQYIPEKYAKIKVHKNCIIGLSHNFFDDLFHDDFIINTSVIDVNIEPIKGMKNHIVNTNTLAVCDVNKYALTFE